MMSVKEMLELYSGFSPEKYALIKRYVIQFKEPWALRGPMNDELILHCLDLNTRLDDLPRDDPMILKYFDGERLY